MTELNQEVVGINGLVVRYGRSVAVDDVSLTVLPGQVYALLGRNGAGKSSLVRCLLGQRRPDGGGVELFGEDAWSQRARLMTRVGVVPESPEVPPDMTADELAAFCGWIYQRWDRAAWSRRLERFAVPRQTPFGRLSRGQKAQVGLAAALSHNPDLLVLDDPTLGLDAVARRSVFEELIEELADRGTTVLLTTHDLEGAERVADRVGILKGGRLVLDESVDDLKARFRRLSFRGESEPEHPYSTVHRRRGSFGLEAVVSDYAEPAPVEAEVGVLSLEEIFVAVAGEEKGAGS